MVTGAAGFIGSHFVDYVLENHSQDQVIGFDCLTYAGNMNNLELAIPNKRFQFVKGDIRNLDQVDPIVAKVDAIVNFAAESHVDRSIDNSTNFVSTNVLGVGNLLESSLKHRIDFFHQVSTDEVYGSIEAGSSSEDSKLKPRSPYAASKAAADLLVNSFHITHGLNTLITRASNNYGTRQFPEKIIPHFLNLLLSGRQVPLYGDGLQIRDWIHVKDHVSAIRFCQEKFLGVNQIVNIPGNKSISNIELTKLLLNIMKLTEKHIKYVTDRKGHDRRYSMDGSLLINKGFKFQYEFETELQAVVDFYKDQITSDVVK